MNTRISDRKATSWLSLAIAMAFVAVAVFAVVTYRNTLAVRQNEALLIRSYVVREAAREFLASVKDMETGQRGFLITGDPAYLEPYYTGLSQVEDNFARLEKITLDSPIQGSRVQKLQKLLMDKQQEIAETIALRGEEAESGGFDKARELVLAGQGNRIMAEMRAVVQELLDEEKGLLVDREAAALSRTVVSKILIVTGNLIALALLVLSGFAAHVDRKKRDEAEARLRFSQAELGAIVRLGGRRHRCLQSRPHDSFDEPRRSQVAPLRRLGGDWPFPTRFRPHTVSCDCC